MPGLPPRRSHGRGRSAASPRRRVELRRPCRSGRERRRAAGPRRRPRRGRGRWSPGRSVGLARPAPARRWPGPTVGAAGGPAPAHRRSAAWPRPPTPPAPHPGRRARTLPPGAPRARPTAPPARPASGHPSAPATRQQGRGGGVPTPGPAAAGAQPRTALRHGRPGRRRSPRRGSWWRCPWINLLTYTRSNQEVNEICGQLEEAEFEALRTARRLASQAQPNEPRRTFPALPTSTRTEARWRPAQWPGWSAGAAACPARRAHPPDRSRAYDALSARLVEQAGFDAVYLTGFGASASSWTPRRRPAVGQRDGRPGTPSRRRRRTAGHRRRRHRLRQRHQRGPDRARLRAGRRGGDAPRGPGDAQEVRPHVRQGRDPARGDGRQDPRSDRGAPRPRSRPDRAHGRSGGARPRRRDHPGPRLRGRRRRRAVRRGPHQRGRHRPGRGGAPPRGSAGVQLGRGRQDTPDPVGADRRGLASRW